MAKVEFKKLYEDSILPTKAHRSDAGFDLYAHSVHRMIDGDLRQVISHNGEWELYHGDQVLVKTGFGMSIPEGYEAQIRPRSGLALKHGVTVTNSPGTIDCSWRAEVGVILCKVTKGYWFKFKSGDRIAQMVISKLADIDVVEVEELSATSERGDAGYGSSGR